MSVQDYLDQMGVNYRLSRHDTAYTAADLAHVEHVPGRKVIKPVVIKADGQFVMCALPASHRVDLDTLRCQLQCNDVELADEMDLAKIFPDCEVGAEPPFGALYELPVYVSPILARDEEITFNGGSHEEAIRMKYDDFARLTQPSIIHLSSE